MNISNHAKERYVERIKGITDKQEIKRYIATEEERIEKEIDKLYQYSELIFTGQIGGDRATKSFRLNKDICLVVNVDCIITIYRINFAFPEHTRQMVIEDLKNEILRLQQDIYDESNKLLEQDCEIDNKINSLQIEIKQLQDEIELKKAEIEMYQASKKASRKHLQELKSTLQTYAEQLLGNTQYKKDIY